MAVEGKETPSRRRAKGRPGTEGQKEQMTSFLFLRLCIVELKACLDLATTPETRSNSTPFLRPRTRLSFFRVFRNKHLNIEKTDSSSHSRKVRPFQLRRKDP